MRGRNLTDVNELPAAGIFMNRDATRRLLKDGLSHRTPSCLKIAAATVLILSRVSAFAQAPLPSVQTAEESSEKTGRTKWEVQGSIGDKVVIVNDRGDTSAVKAGSEIDGCLVTADKIMCDTPEKTAINKNKSRENEIGTPVHQNMDTFLESSGRTGYSRRLGHIKFAVLDGRLIVRVIRTYYDKAETIFKEAILEEMQDNGYAYYALDRNMVQIEYK